MECFRTIASHIETHWYFGVMRPKSEDHTWADVECISPLTGSQLDAITNFLCRPWFERIWIWQEIRLASQNSVVLCGRQSIPWDFIQNSGFFLYTKPCRPGKRRDELFKTRAALYSICDKIRYVSFDMLIWQTMYAKATDPRDKIYALLSLVHQREAKFTIIPDYTKTLSQVLLDAAIQYVKFCGDLQPLAAVEMHEHISGLPSWVPDWSIPRRTLPLYGFAALSSASRFSLGDQVLQAIGVELSRIELIEPFKLSTEVPRKDVLSVEFKRIATEMGIHEDCIPGSETLRNFCYTLSTGLSSERYIPPRKDMINIRECESILYDAMNDRSIKYWGTKEVKKGKFFSAVAKACLGRSLFISAPGNMGLAPHSAKVGDVVVVFLGLTSPMVLRPTDNGQWIVVGEAYYHSHMDGEALLGTFPGTWDPVWKMSSDGTDWWAYIDRGSGKMQIQDPRLGELPFGWRIENHKEDEYWNLYVNDTLNKRTGRDPRISLEALIERGVELKEFELI